MEAGTVSANIGLLAVVNVQPEAGTFELRCPSCDGSGGWLWFPAGAEWPYDYCVDHRDDCPRDLERRATDATELSRLRADHATRGVALEHALAGLDEANAQLAKQARENAELRQALRRRNEGDML